MRKLDRTAATIPACLASCDYNTHRWDDAPSLDKAQIRNSLEQMQGKRCAYCEGGLDQLGQHIEHFRRKGVFRDLTFSWENLYWSCDQNDSCGHYKDHGAATYNPVNLVDPCHDDPDYFFKFHADGAIHIRTGLSPQENHKAAETLRVFNLNPEYGRLRNMRKGAVSGYVQMVDGVTGFTRDDMREFFRDELAATAHLPFSTAIRHVLTEII